MNQIIITCLTLIAFTAAQAAHQAIRKAAVIFTAAYLFARHVLSLGDASSLRAVVNGTARLGQGVRREAESDREPTPKLGLDEQKPDTRPATLGNAAMDADAQYSLGSVAG
jgi:hypothetical protein